MLHKYMDIVQIPMTLSNKSSLKLRKKMNSFIDLSSNLTSDYEKLYESGRYADILIHVGKEPNNKIFLAHTVVLCTRSKSIENSLTENKETSDAIQKAVISFEDVSPDVFEILLRYIYAGRIPCDLCKNVGWLDLLDGASKFELVDLLAAIETYLLDQENEWIQQNVLTIHKYAASKVSLNKLLAYCNRIMVSHPEIIFKSNDLATLPKETLMTLLKSDELDMNEDDILISVIQWAIKQVPELELENDPDCWSFNDNNVIKDIVADFMPYLRFVSISLKKIILYDDLLPKKLRHDILNYHTDKDYKPKTPLLPPRAGQSHILPLKTGQEYDIDSVLINNKQAAWISSKIVESAKQLHENQETSINKDDVYKLTLLYSCSRDATKFRELCDDKGPTVAVGKVLNTEEILGGYNPLSWRSSRNAYAETKESFIFALDRNIENSIVSFVGNNGFHAIYDHSTFFPTFGSGHDLHFGTESGGQPYTYYNANTYQVPIRSFTLSGSSFRWADWEVFLVSKV